MPSTGVVEHHLILSKEKSLVLERIRVIIIHHLTFINFML